MLNPKQYLLVLMPLTITSYSLALNLANKTSFLNLSTSMISFMILVGISIIYIIYICEKEETELVSDHLNIE